MKMRKFYKREGEIFEYIYTEEEVIDDRLTFLLAIRA